MIAHSSCQLVKATLKFLNWALYHFSTEAKQLYLTALAN